MLSVLCIGRWAKILFSIEEGIIKNISYERRDYESVEEKSLSAMSLRAFSYVTKDGEKRILVLD